MILRKLDDVICFGSDTSSSILGNEGSVIIHRYQPGARAFASGSFQVGEGKTKQKEWCEGEKRAKTKDGKGKKERENGGFSLQSFLYGNHGMPVSGPEPRVWHNNLRFKSNLGYISDPSTRARPPTSSGRSVLSPSSPSLSLSISFSEWNAKGEGENP